jgi:hypothetical protein
LNGGQYVIFKVVSMEWFALYYLWIAVTSTLDNGYHHRIAAQFTVHGVGFCGDLLYRVRPNGNLWRPN